MDRRLYNVIFPTCLIVTCIPSFFLLFALAGNFIIDSLVVLFISNMVFRKLCKCFYKKVILKVWFLGYVADCLAAIFLMILNEYYYLMYKHTVDNLTYVVFSILGIIAASILIFIFNYFISFRKIEMTKKQKFLSTVILAIATAPYTFLIPEYLFYQ